MKKIDRQLYLDIYQPRLSRRQQLAFNAFYELNRERDYVSTQIGAIPMNIKKTAIHRYWTTLHEPIALAYFTLFIQMLDDAFIEHSSQQAKAASHA